MNRILILIFVTSLSLPTETFAARPVVLWAKTFRSKSSREVVKDLVVDSTGNVIVVGDASNEGFVFKFDPQGEVQWKLDLESIYPAADEYRQSWAVEVDQHDNIYVSANANNQLCIEVLSPQGKSIKSYQHVHKRLSRVFDMAATEGDFILGGQMTDGFRGGKKKRLTTDTLLAKLNPDLKFVDFVDIDRSKTKIHGYARHVDSAKKIITGVATLPDGDLALVGNVFVMGDSHTYLQVRSKQLGGIRWAKRLTWPRMLDVEGSESISAKTIYPKVACDARGNIYIAWDRWMGNRQGRRYYVNCCVSMYSKSGELKWEHITHLESGDDSAYSIAIGKNDIAYVAASYNDRPTLLRYTRKPHIALPFFVFSDKPSVCGGARAVGVAPDGTIYVAGVANNVFEQEIEPTADKPWTMNAKGTVCFIARIAVTTGSSKLAAPEG